MNPPDHSPDTERRRLRERRRRQRRASDVAKVHCPYCGGMRSQIYVSKPVGLHRGDGYRRRRVCAECVDLGGRPRTWPTVEQTDWRLLERELAQQGLTFEAIDVRVVDNAEG